jgi:hypothetical protein
MQSKIWKTVKQLAEVVRLFIKKGFYKKLVNILGVEMVKEE